MVARTRAKKLAYEFPVASQSRSSLPAEHALELVKEGLVSGKQLAKG
jgi:hypothetical protein